MGNTATKPDGTPGVRAVLAGLLAAVVILAGTALGAQKLLGSELYSKSRLISMIVAQDTIGIADIAADRRNVRMVFQFVGALTSAYIDFELIPVGEVGTFATVFESVRDEITVDKFTYRRKNLTISGHAETKEDYEAFVSRLEESGYFESVSGHEYTATDDTTRFEVECVSASASATLVFE